MLNWLKPRRIEREVEVDQPPVRLRVALDFRATVVLDEEMMGALDALVGYGDDAFLKMFKQMLGEAYIRDYERGLKRFFTAVREQVLPSLADVKTAKRDLWSAMRAREEARETRRQATKAEVD